MKPNLILARLGATGMFGGWVLAVLLVATIGRRFPLIGLVGILVAFACFSFTFVVGKCQQCGISLIAKPQPQLQALLNLVILPIWIPVPCAACGHKNT